MSGMFDDLIPAAPPAAPAPAAGGGMFDDLVPPAPAGAAPSRFGVNVAEGFRGTLLGEAIERTRAGQVAAEAAGQYEAAAGRLGPDGRSLPATPARRGPFGSTYVAPTYDLTAEELAAQAAPLRAEANARAQDYRTRIIPERRAEEAALGSWNQGGIVDRVVQGATALAGQLVGGMGSPESYVGPAGARIARQGGETLVPYIGRQAVESGAPNAAIAAGVDPIIQGGEIDRGTREAYSPLDTALAAAMGGVIGTGLPVSMDFVRGIAARFRGRPDPTSPTGTAPPTPEDIAASITDQDVLALARANGITDPADPRVASAIERLAARRQAEATRAAVAPSVTQADLRAGAEAVAEGANPATVAPPQRAPVPPVVALPELAPGTVPTRGTADPNAVGVAEGVALRGGGGSTSLVPVQPQPNRMTPGEIARAQAQIEGGTPNAAEPPPRLVTPEGGAPRTPGEIQDRRQAGEAFDVAAARRERRDAALPGDPPADMRAGGRPEGRGEPEAFAFVDAQMSRGQMTAGRRVEVLGRDADGNVAVRDADTGRIEIVTGDRVTEMGRPANPRMAQEFAGAAQQPPRGVGLENAPQREATDRVTSRQATDPRGPDDGGEYVGRAPEPRGPIRDVPGDPEIRAPQNAPEAAAPAPRAPEGGSGAEAPVARQEPTRALPAPDRPAASPEVRQVSPEPPRPDVPAPLSQADRSRAAADRLSAEAATLRDIRSRFFDAGTGRRAEPAKGKQPRDVRAAEAQAAKYKDRTGITRAIEAKEREAAAARGREKIQRRAAEGEATGSPLPIRQTYDAPADNRPISQAPPAAPERISYAVRRLGGISGGKFDGVRVNSPELEGSRPGVRNKNGLPMERMIQALKEDGWSFTSRAADQEGMGGGIGARFDMDEEAVLRDMLRRDAGQEPVYREGDRADFDEARARAAAEDDAISRIADELGLEGNERAGLTRGQFEDLLAERTSQERLAEAERARADAERAEVEEIRRMSQDGRGESWEPDIRGDVDDYLAGYGTRSLDDAEASSRAADDGAGNGVPGERAPDAGEPRGEGRASDPPGAAAETRDRAGDPARGDGEAGAGGERGAAGGEPRREGVAGRDPLRRTVESDGQAVLPGAEASTRQATQARAEAPNRGRTAQKDMNAFEMFDTNARNQADLIDGAGRVAGDDDFRGRLFSGTAMFDPAAWRWAFGPAARYLGEPFQKAWNEATAALRGGQGRGTEGRVPRDPNSFWSKMPNPLRTLGHMSRAVFYADDARMRYLADNLPPEAREAGMAFLDRWHARAGEGRAAGATFDERVDRGLNGNLRRLGKALGEDVMTDSAVMAQVTRLVQNPGNIRTGTKLGDAAQAVTDLLRDLHKMQTDAGVEMGRISRGYFPRMVDVDAVWRDREGFLAAATRIYRQAGEANPAVAAQAWLDNILAGGKHDQALAPPNNGIHADHVNGRELPKNTDEVMRAYLHQDPRHVLTAYIMSAVRRAEFARAIGGKEQTHWRALTDALKKDGAHARIEDFRAYVGNVTGTAYAGANRTLVRATANIRMFATLGLLEKATMSSLAEAIMPAVRSNNVGDLPRALYRTVDDLVRGTRGNGDAVRLRELSEDIGIISSAHASSLNSARWSGGDAASGFQSLALDRYFRRIGLEQWTRATRVAALSTAEVFLRRMATDVARAGEGDNAVARAWRGKNGRVAQHALAELGIPRDQHAAFGAWIAQHGDGMTASALHTAPPAMAELFRTAASRFVDQSIMRPSAATRPRWASTPLGAVAFQLNNFAWAFHKNVLGRPMNMLRSGDLTGADKAIYAAQMLGGISMMVPAQAAISYLRSELFDDEKSKQRRRTQAAREPVFQNPITGENVGRDQIMLVLSRSGLLGGADPLFNLVTGVRYGRDLATSAAGPALGTVLGAAQTAIEAGTRNSPNTNSAERRVARAAYDVGIEPSVNLMATFLPLPVGAVITQAMGHGATRAAFMDATAGPEARDNRRRRE
jgi:hypothetical protein